MTVAEKIKSIEGGGRCQGGEGGFVFHARWVREARLRGARAENPGRAEAEQVPGSEGPGDLRWGVSPGWAGRAKCGQ